MDFRNGNFQVKMSEIALVLGICLLFASLFLIVVISNLEIPFIAEIGTEAKELIANTNGWKGNTNGFGWIFSGG